MSADTKADLHLNSTVTTTTTTTTTTTATNQQPSNSFNHNQTKLTPIIEYSEENTKLNINDDCGKTSSKIRPPDGGYGWVVVFASFMCNVVVDGIIFSFGILLLEISNEFNEKKGITAWIGSLQAGFYLIAGPLVSALANMFGCRMITVFGSILAASGFILSFFATNVVMLYITFGILGGIGFGFIFLPAIVTVGFYFEKRRAFATGIAVCGSGIGAFVMAPVTQYLIECFGWRGSVLILAGFTLNCAVFGSLFRPIETTRRVSQSHKPLLIRIKEARDALWSESDEEVEESPTASHNSAPPPYCEIIGSFNGAINNQCDQSLLDPPSYHINMQNADRRRTKSVVESSIYYKDDHQIIYSAMSLAAYRKKFQLSQHSSHINSHKKLTISNKSLNKTDRLPEKLSSESLSQSQTVCFSSLNQMFDLSLLTSPSFLLLSISGFLTLSGFFIPFMYITDRAVLLGYTREKGAFLLSIIGITNTIGRVFCGWISDRPQVDALLINNIALTIGGTVTILSPIIVNTYTTLIIYSAVFGFSIACFAALRSVITVELLGLERLASAFGLLLLFQGLAVTIGSPIAGWFYDITGSYDYSFYLSGSVIALSGIMCFSLPAISKWEKGKPGFGAIN